MDLNSPFALLSASVVAVVLLRIFFTLWAPLDRKLNGKAARRPDSGPEVGPVDLQGSVLDVRFKSGVALEDVILTSRYAPDLDDFDNLGDLNQILSLRAQDGRRYFVRASEIEYFEQAPAAPPPPPSLTSGAPTAPDSPHAPDPDAPDPDAPENWS